jgi:hypothetical protein
MLIHNQVCQNIEIIPVKVAPEILREPTRIHRKLYRGLQIKDSV